MVLLDILGVQKGKYMAANFSYLEAKQDFYIIIVLQSCFKAKLYKISFDVW